MLKALFKSAGLLAASLLLSSIATQPASAAGQPSILAAQACAVSERDAAVMYTDPVTLPALAKLQGATGTAHVRIDLAASGAVAKTSIAKSSGNRWLDSEALRSANASTFQPEIRGCEPVAGSYLFIVSFDE